jgi:hypothetical protein
VKIAYSLNRSNNLHQNLGALMGLARSADQCSQSRVSVMHAQLSGRIGMLSDISTFKREH